MLPSSGNSVDTSALAFRDRLEVHLPSLKRRALSLTRTAADADDLLNDTIERALRFERTFIPGTMLKAWLFRVMLSIFISKQRTRKRERRALDGMCHDPCAWPKVDRYPEMLGLSPNVQQAVRVLPEKFSEVLWLVDVHDLSYREAADVLEVPVGTIMSRLSRGRRRLAALLCETDSIGQAA